MLPAEIYAARKPAPRKKSDWMYERALETGALHHVLADLGWADADTVSRLEAEMHHEKRAALVCLLKAGLAHVGKATVVGDAAGGWFWLPPAALWANWARKGLEESLARTRKRRFPEASLWTRPAQ